MTDLVERLREGAVSILNDGTPSQVGPDPTELERVAALIERQSAEIASLTEECNQGMVEMTNLRNDLEAAHAKAERHSAALRTAREALHYYVDEHEVPREGPWGVFSDDFGKVAAQALADMEGVGNG